MNAEQRKRLEEIKATNGEHPFSAVGYEWLVSTLEAEAAERDKLAERVRVLERCLGHLLDMVSPDNLTTQTYVADARAALDPKEEER